MAITPKEALGNKREKEAAAIDKLEKSFDELLSKSFDGRKAITIQGPFGVSDFIVREVVARFEKAGWDVKREKREQGDDQRDGSWDNLTFTERVKPYPQMGDEGR